MTTTTRLGLAALLLVAACDTKNVYELDIPCESDEHCPTGAYCELELEQCFEDFDDKGPPAVAIDGLARTKDGPFASDVGVLTTDGTIVWLRIRNAGSGQISYPEVEVTGPACLDITSGFFGGNLAGILDPGDTYTDRFQVRYRCSGPAELNILVRAEKRIFEAKATLKPGT